MDTINFSACEVLQEKNTQESKERKSDETVRGKGIKKTLQHR